MPHDEPWTIGRLLTWTTDYLGKQGADNARLDAEVLLAAARGCRRIDLYAAYQEETSDQQRQEFRELVRRRAAGTPVAYLVGHREFFSLNFEVTPDVLIPRPETEMLLVALTDLVKARPTLAVERQTQQPLRIADVGTGSGAIAVCAARHVAGSHVVTLDVSAEALAVARKNVERHQVADRVQLVESDLFTALPDDETFDFILSNPPYVTTAEMAKLPCDVRDHEPRLALDGGKEGTDVIERLIPAAAERLRPGGALLIEVSPMIARRVEEMVKNQPSLELGPTLRDPAGHDRVVQAPAATTSDAD